MNDFEVREVLFRNNKSKTDICPYCRVVDDTAQFLFSCVSYGNRTFRQRRFGKKIETFRQVFHAETSRIILVLFLVFYKLVRSSL